VLNQGTPHTQHAPTPSQDVGFEEDRDTPTITQTTVTLYDGMQMPTIIERLSPLQNLALTNEPNEVFSFDFLKKILGGSSVSDGFYSISSKSKARRLYPNLKFYRALDAEYPPLLPRSLGQHGAQLSCILAELDVDSSKAIRFPLFIRGGRGYKYFGEYCENRYSDYLGAN